jgi:hypothetical protein
MKLKELKKSKTNLESRKYKMLEMLQIKSEMKQKLKPRNSEKRQQREKKMNKMQLKQQN